jgi:asparagine synthase (glutamine-hydrolysing)
LSAIAGYWSFSGRPGARHCCERMLAAQHVYGPGRPVCWSESGISLGRRLFPLLPEDVHDVAPVAGADRVLVADIRLDNRSELCADLGLSKAEARTLSDAALLMAALARWDEAALDRLVGDFAFAFWNGRERKLLLARDPLGQRPLVYHQGVDFVAFSSMPKGLHALPDIPRKPDARTMAGFLALLPETADETYFEGVRKVRSGHVVTVAAGRVCSRRYWNPRSKLLRLAGPADYEEAVREGLDRAVAAQLRGAGARVGAHLSGGLDSSAVAATAARTLGGEGSVVAYTSVPRDGWNGGGGDSLADEGPLAAAVAALYPNMEHVRIAAGGGSPFAVMERASDLHERPVLNACNGVWFDAILQDAADRGLKVLLTGQCGNLSFSQDGMALLGSLLREARVPQLARTAWSLLRHGARAGTVAARILGPLLPRSALQGIARLRGKSGDLADFTALNPALLPAMRQRARASARDLADRSRDPRDAWTWGLERVDFGNFNKGALGGWGVDLRDPTADRRLIELCLTIPPEQFLAGGIPRSLARRALADRLPRIVLDERRKGYQAADWNEGLSAARPELADAIERIAQVPEAAALLDLDKMRRLVEAWPDGGWHRDRTIASYRQALLRGTSAGHFMWRASGGAA